MLSKTATLAATLVVAALTPSCLVHAQVEILTSYRFGTVYLDNSTPYYYTPSRTFTETAPTVSGDFATNFYISGFPGTTVAQSSTVSNGRLNGSFRVRSASNFYNDQARTGYVVKFRVPGVVHFTVQAQQRDAINSGTQFYVALGSPSNESVVSTLGGGYPNPPYFVKEPPTSPVGGFLVPGDYTFFASLFAYYHSAPEGEKGLTAAFDLSFTPVVAPRFLNISPKQRAFEGKVIDLTFAAEGNYLEIAWFKNGQSIPNATGATYTIPSFTDQDAGSYTVTLSNPAGTATSEPIIVEAKVRVAPVIQNASPSRRAFNGEEVTLTFSATGDAYETTWLKNDVPIPGATGPTYTIPSFSSDDVATYLVRLSNGAGTVISSPILVGADSRLRNIATRAVVGAGEDVLIVGFTVAGTAPRDVLLRAAGPRLASFGIAQPLANPVLRLFDQSGQLLATNESWEQGGSNTIQELQTAIGEVGAFDFQPGSLDAALTRSLKPGSYTVQVSSNGTDNGIALAEVYDRTPARGANRIKNLSTRARVGTDQSIVIPGVVIEGNGTQRLLVRAIGPTLSQFGVSGVLPNPGLRIYDAAGQVVAENMTWGTGPNSDASAITSAAQTSGAFALALGTDDAALLLELPAGNYTAQVFDEGNASGVALIEVYAQ